MKYFKLGLILLPILFSCQHKGNEAKTECEEGINLRPMYGRVEKCREQLEADERFLSRSDKEEANRSKASIQMLDNAWYYLHQGDYNTAMKRANQAWLLDSTNIATYASFAVILDLKGELDDAKEILGVTFDKLENTQEANKVELFSFIVNNTLFCYKKTNNPKVGEFVKEKLSSFNLNAAESDKLNVILDQFVNTK